MTSSITILTIAPHHAKKGGGFVDAGAASKVITRKPDGSLDVQGYGNAKYYAAEVLPVQDFCGLVAILRDLEQYPQSFVVRGIPKPGVNCEYMRRNIHSKVDKDTGEELERAEMQPDPNGLQWIMVDLDDLPNPLGGLPPKDEAETIALVQAVIKEYLPWYFQDRACYFQFSSSQGIKGGWQNIRLHLWFWLNRPIPDKILHDVWADKINREYKKVKPDVKKLIDPAVYVSTQPNYTAAPVLIGFEHPPVACRSGIVPGSAEEVVIPEAELVKIDQRKLTYPKNESPLAEKYSGDWLMIEKAINTLPSDCDYEDEFVPVGIALYNASNGGAMGLNLWQSLARRRDAVRPRDYHKPDKLERKWAGLYGYKLPASAIFYIAKRYGFELPKPERFKETENGKRKLSASELMKQKAAAIAPDTVRADPTAEAEEPARPLALPPGFEMIEGVLNKLFPIQTKDGDSFGVPREIYPGELRVIAARVNVDTEEYSLVVEYATRGGKKRTITAPKAKLSSRRGVVEILGATGAPVYENNAGDVAEYLVKYFEHNRNQIPHSGFTTHLGMIGDVGLVTPACSIATKAEYKGEYVGAVGHDEDILHETFAEIARWKEDPAQQMTYPTPLFLDIGWCLASPILGLMRRRGILRRNPVLMMTGESGSGKSTSRFAAMAAWGDPEVFPFKAEATKSTTLGLLRTSHKLLGLPMHLDEVHTCKKPDDIESFAFGFANGQEPVQGSQQYGEIKGGGQLFGTLMLTGEHPLEFKSTGAFRRILHINADHIPPLGVPSKINLVDRNPEGLRRAELLKRYWSQSAGMIGPRLYEYLLGFLDDFITEAQELAALPAYSGLEQWAEVTAVAVLTLQHLYKFLDMPIPEAISHIPALVQSAVDSAKDGEGDPAITAWNNFTGLMASTTRVEINGYPCYMARGNELIAWRSEDVLYLNSTCPAFQQAVPGFRHVRNIWLKRGLLLPMGKAKREALQPRRAPNGFSVQAGKISLARIEGEADAG